MIRKDHIFRFLAELDLSIEWEVGKCILIFFILMHYRIHLNLF